MTPGTVLFDKNFTFHDGASAEKLFVLLSDDSAGVYVAIKTTSQPQHKGRDEGCQTSDKYPNFYVPDGTTFLRGESWLLLGEFYEFDSTRLRHKVSTGEIRQVGNLPRDVIVELLACAIDCFDISDRQADILRNIMPSL